MELFHHVLVYMGTLYLVLPSTNLSSLDAGILSKFDDVLLEHGGLPHVLPLAVHLEFFGWTSRGDHSKVFLLFGFCCGTPPSCLKVRGGGWWWVAWSNLVSAQGPLVLGLGLWG